MKGFFKYINNKKKTKDNGGGNSSTNGGGIMVTKDTGKAELSNAFFALASTDKSCEEPLTQETRLKDCWKEVFPLVKEDWAREHLNKLDIPKSMGPNGMYP
ncbi:rna-directed dna polymerase from mobile element jockey-like [Pitangus sulphuratus]|nr:rna-directed dna polymerase from mobile element jockey-like [Pitangus sulphuratus]